MHCLPTSVRPLYVPWSCLENRQDRSIVDTADYVASVRSSLRRRQSGQVSRRTTASVVNRVRPSEPVVNSTLIVRCVDHTCDMT